MTAIVQTRHHGAWVRLYYCSISGVTCGGTDSALWTYYFYLFSKTLRVFFLFQRSSLHLTPHSVVRPTLLQLTIIIIIWTGWKCPTNAELATNWNHARVEQVKSRCPSYYQTKGCWNFYHPPSQPPFIAVVCCCSRHNNWKVYLAN